ncbi:glucosyltransferase [Burkholderia sp. Leaf177]|nr:bacteriohopanetetrol glucosamine biosynthesis glycosyltransferase HpnI [Burkholderia sp. Leaf177]KQR77237.1 glucosyltransferase [Burkholderia sp. Leaf177]
MWITASCVVFGVSYTVVATFLVRRFFARPVVEATTFPAVTIVKPLHGAELALMQNLVSFCEQDYPGPIQFLFGVHDSRDVALDVVRHVRGLFPDADITVVSDARLYGPNRKMSNVLNMLPEARHDILVFADSDVAVEQNYLRRVVGELHQPGVGLVTCLYWGKPDTGFWGSLSADASNYQFLPGVVLGLASGLAQPCFGQTLAMRRATLEKIGGFSQFVHHLAEDHAIGEAVRLAGEKVVVPAFAVTHACVEKNAAEFVAHELRWSRTIRTIDPAGHLGSVLTHPLAFALLSVVVSGGAIWAWTTVGTAIIARLALKLQMNKALRRPAAGIALLPIWDIVLFAVYLLSFVSSRVVWRGFNFTVGRDGLLVPVTEE